MPSPLLGSSLRRKKASVRKPPARTSPAFAGDRPVRKIIREPLMTALPQERRVVTAIPGPKSQELQARRTAVVAAGVGSVLPVFTTRARRRIIEDVDGNRLIDFGSGIAVTSVGASAEAVVRRASAQLQDFTHTCFMVTPYEGYVAVAEALAELTPGDHAKKSALFNSGAEAVENAVKIARAYTKRQAVVVFDHGYHGRTNLTMALTAKNMPYKNGFGPFAPEVYRVPVAYGYRWLTGPENAGRRGVRPGHRHDQQADRRRQRRRDHHRAAARRGRLHRAREGLPALPSASSPRTTASSSSRTRSSPASAAPASGSRARTRASSRT